jgi:diaminopimelate decarboxylase
VVGPAGLLLARVVREKRLNGRRYVVVDAGMNDLLRPALYQAYHRVLPVRPGGEERTPAEVVGPVCESGDFLAHQALLPPLATGDLVAVMDAGAYGFAMASNYNARPRPAEVMVWRGRTTVVRARETWPDLMRGEGLPPGA